MTIVKNLLQIVELIFGLNKPFKNICEIQMYIYKKSDPEFVYYKTASSKLNRLARQTDRQA